MTDRQELRRRVRAAGTAAVVALVVGLFALPQLDGLFPDFVDNSLLFRLTQLFMLVVVACSWNLTGGFTGYIDFGHAVWFGFGAFGTGVLMAKQDWPFVPALLAGALVSALFAVLIGSATLRLRGPYFSIAMLGTFVAVREIVRVWKPLTGGGTGLTLPPYLNRPLFYYVTLLLLLAFLAFTRWMRRTQFGASLVAIREDEVGADMRGVNTTATKISVFAIAAFVTGLVGGLWAYQNTFISPDIVFVDSRTLDAVMMAMLGGLGTVIGPVIGATVIYWLRDVVWANFLDYHLIIQGVLLILIVLFVPEGVVGRLSRSARATSLARLWARPGGWIGATAPASPLEPVEPDPAPVAPAGAAEPGGTEGASGGAPASATAAGER